MDEASRGWAKVRLRPTVEADLPRFFDHQCDPVARHAAAFVSTDPNDRDGFLAKWYNLLAEPSIVARTILVDERVVGHVARFLHKERPNVTYWIGREFWGRGIATAALRAFLLEHVERPLYASAAADNRASLRVLEKCGFRATSKEWSFAATRDREIEEVMLERA